ncbi:cytochrome P450 [Xylaria sp. FL1042]|nr:cytochrome P450 [Xylaria sp. FL1042]
MDVVSILIEHQSLIIICLPLCVFLVFSIFRLKPQPQLLDGPLYSNETGDFRAMLQEGYVKNGNRIFRIPTSNLPMYIVPPKFLQELHKLPERSMSFRREMYDRFLGRYTAFASNEDAMVKAIKVDLTKSIDSLLPSMTEEADYAISNSLNVSSDITWTRVPLHSVSTRLITFLSGRTFVGLPLSRSPEWIDAAINVTLNAMRGSGKLWQYPSWCWPVVQYFLPETKGVKFYFDKTAEMLVSVLKDRRQAMSSPEFKPPSDMTQCLVQHSKEYLEPLRKEIEENMSEGGSLMKLSLYRMKKMDSFLREVQRLSAPGLVSVNRKVLQPVTLSDGTRLPVNTSIAVAADAVARYLA